MLHEPLTRDEQDDLFRQMEKWLRSTNGELVEKRMVPSELENMYRMRATILALRDCPDCGGSGAVDSGGVQPWGASIDVPCTTCAPSPIERAINAIISSWAEWDAEASQDAQREHDFAAYVATMKSHLRRVMTGTDDQ